MEPRPVELAKAVWEAWLRGDLDAMDELWHPDIEWGALPDWPEDAVYHGKAGVRGFLEEWLASWEGYDAGVDEYLEVGDRVVVISWQNMTGPDSGAPVRLDVAQVLSFEDGKIRRVDNYPSRAEALAAASA